MYDGVTTGCLILLGLLITCSAAQGQAKEDVRFTQRHDKDRPVEFKPTFASAPEWERRATSLRHQVLVSQGLWPMPEKTPLNPVVHGRIDRDGYTIEKVFFASLPGHYVTGNLYRPKGRTGKLPAVLRPYGHWPDGRFIWKKEEDVEKDLASGAERTREAARSPLQASCAMLARMGCVVFHYDMVGYGDSKPIEHRKGFTDVESILRLQSMMGLQTWNGIRAVDFVTGLEDVDPARIAVAGASGGGTQSILLGTVDDRVAAMFPAVMVSMNMQGGCVCENAPLLRVGTNNVELPSLFAPKPLCAAAAKDWTHDFETRGLPEMKAIWSLYGAADRVGGKFFPYGHNFNVHSRELMYDFMNRALGLGREGPVKEESFEPAHPKELTVFDDAHPMPADAADAAGVREGMTKANGEQMAALANDPRKHAEVLRVAVEAMVVDRMPSSDEVEYDGPAIKPGGDGDGYITRAGAGERVPCATRMPKDWNGTVVVMSHPKGAAEAVRSDEATRLVEAGARVIAIAPFLSETFRPAKPLPPIGSGSDLNPPYAAFALGYNRGVLANRVHDLLTAVAVARGIDGVKSVRLLGVEDTGPATLLAHALAGDAVDRAAIDMNQFDFDQVRDDDDPMLLPGGLKYGGIHAFTTLCAGRPTLLVNSRTAEEHAPPNEVTIEPAAPAGTRLTDWLLSATPR